VYREVLRPVLVDGAAMIGSILRRRGAPNQVAMSRNHYRTVPVITEQFV